MKNLSFYELGLCVSSLTTLGNVGLNALYTFEINLPQFKVQFYKWSILRNSNDLSKITQLISDYIWIRSNFPVAQMVKRLPTMQETQVQSLGWDDFLEKEMATHSSILAWKIPWREDPGGLQSIRSQRVGHNWATKHSTACLCWILVPQAGIELTPSAVKAWTARESPSFVYHKSSKYRGRSWQYIKEEYN